MRVVTWNVQHGRRPDGVVDTGGLAAAAASLDADVLALQEVDRGVGRSGGADQAAAIAEATGMDAVFSASLSFPSAGSYGNTLLVRGTIGTWRVVRLPRWPRHEPRTAILARVDTPSAGEATVVCTHLSTHGVEARWQLMRVLADAVAGPEPFRHPLLVVGDLNLPPGPVAARAGGRFAVADAPPSFPAAAPGRAIDHVLVAGPARIGSVTACRLPISDHLAVIVRIERD